MPNEQFPRKYWWLVLVAVPIIGATVPIIVAIIQHPPPPGAEDAPVIEPVKYAHGEEYVNVELSDWVVIYEPEKGGRGEALDYLHRIEFGDQNTPKTIPQVTIGVEFPLGHTGPKKYPYSYVDHAVNITEDGFSVKLIKSSHSKSTEAAKISWQASWE
ncbi:MAG: hypothetical protein AAGN46_01570 [Acidobacteriota bacterium]